MNCAKKTNNMVVERHRPRDKVSLLFLATCYLFLCLPFKSDMVVLDNEVKFVIRVNSYREGWSACIGTFALKLLQIKPPLGSRGFFHSPPFESAARSWLLLQPAAPPTTFAKSLPWVHAWAWLCHCGLPSSMSASESLRKVYLFHLRMRSELNARNNRPAHVRAHAQNNHSSSSLPPLRSAP